MPTSDIGIDLGTRNSLAYSTGKGLVLNEPISVIPLGTQILILGLRKALLPIALDIKYFNIFSVTV